MNIPTQIKSCSKVIGSFADTDENEVFCDGDACIIAGSPEAIKVYLDKLSSSGDATDIIRKTRFGEIVAGLSKGGAYVFDEVSYARFSDNAKNNRMGELPTEKIFSESSSDMQFIRIQILDEK